MSLLLLISSSLILINIPTNWERTECSSAWEERNRKSQKHLIGPLIGQCVEGEHRQSAEVGKSRARRGTWWNTAAADGNGTTLQCEMLFQLKSVRNCLSLRLAFPLPLCSLITGESFEQSAFENKLSAVFLKKTKKQQICWKYARGCSERRREGDENVSSSKTC